jgi:hypothetical protein
MTVWQILLLYAALQIVWTLLIRAFPEVVTGLLLKGVEHRYTVQAENIKDELGRNTQRALEQFKYENSASLDRAVKFHQREFDVLPEAWGLLVDAFSITRPVALGAVIAPDINKMTAEQFEDFLRKIPLAQWQKNELMAAPDKVRYYISAISWHDMTRAEACCGKFHEYILKNGIFILPDIKRKFSQFDDLLAEAIGERRMSLQYTDTHQRLEKGAILHNDGQRLLKSLEEDVQARLWHSHADEQ